MLKIPPEGTEYLPPASLSIIELCSWSPPKFSTTIKGAESLLHHNPPNIKWSQIVKQPVPPQSLVKAMNTHLLGIEDSQTSSVSLPLVLLDGHFPLDAILYWQQAIVATEARRKSWIKACDFLEQAPIVDNPRLQMSHLRKEVEDLLKQTPWGTTIVTGLSKESLPVSKLTGLLSEEWMTGDILDEMLTIVNQQLKESSSVT